MSVLLDCVRALVRKGYMTQAESDETVAWFKQNPAFLRQWALGMTLYPMED